MSIWAGCKKRPFDDRNKYTGEWNFEVNEEFYNISKDSMISVTSESREGSINRGEGDYDLVIYYGDDRPIYTSVDENGNLELAQGTITKEKMQYELISIGTSSDKIRFKLNIQGEKE